MPLALAYDFHESVYELAVLPAGGVLFGALLIHQLRARQPDTNGARPRMTGVNRSFHQFALAFICLWTVIAGALGVSQYLSLSKAIQAHSFVSTVGVISNPYDREKDGGFSIGDTKFHYDKYVMNGTFKGHIARGGALRSGQLVRVDAVGAEVVRIFR